MDPPPIPPQRSSPTDPPSGRKRPPLVLRVVIVATILFGGFLAYRVVQMVSYFRTHERKHAAGSEELSAATKLIVGDRNGTAHGNTPGAAKLAAEVSGKLK